MLITIFLFIVLLILIIILSLIIKKNNIKYGGINLDNFDTYKDIESEPIESEPVESEPVEPEPVDVFITFLSNAKSFHLSCIRDKVSNNGHYDEYNIHLLNLINDLKNNRTDIITKLTTWKNQLSDSNQEKQIKKILTNINPIFFDKFIEILNQNELNQIINQSKLNQSELNQSELTIYNQQLIDEISKNYNFKKITILIDYLNLTNKFITQIITQIIDTLIICYSKIERSNETDLRLILMKIIQIANKDSTFSTWMKIIKLILLLKYDEYIFYINPDFIQEHINKVLLITDRTFTTFLITAIKLNDIENVKRCIEYGADAVVIDSNSLSPIFIAHIINPEIEELLLKLTNGFKSKSSSSVPIIDNDNINYYIGSIVECKNSNCLDYVKKIGKNISSAVLALTPSTSSNHINTNRFLNNTALIIVELENKDVSVALLPDRIIRQIFNILETNDIQKININMKDFNQNPKFIDLLLNLPIIYTFDINDLRLFKPMKITEFSSIETLNNQLKHDNILVSQYAISAHGDEQVDDSIYCNLNPNILVVMPCKPFTPMIARINELELFYLYSQHKETFAQKFCEIEQQKQKFCIFQNKCPNITLTFNDDTFNFLRAIGYGIFQIPIIFENEITIDNYNDIINPIKHDVLILKSNDDELDDKLDDDILAAKIKQDNFLLQYKKINELSFDKNDDQITLNDVINMIQKHQSELESELESELKSENPKQIVIFLSTCRS